MTTITHARPILIVDDEPDICEALQLALEIEGFSVASAPDRDAALQVLDRLNPAIIFLDYRMPGLDCADFLRLLRQRAAETPIILMTAGIDSAETARSMGLQHHLSKPFDLDQVVALIREIELASQIK